MPRNPKKIKWNFLLAILVNNGMKNMKEYWVSQILGKPCRSIDKERHVSKNSIYLCDYTTVHPSLSTLHNYSINNIYGVFDVPICKICLNKLPKKVKEEFIYNWTVTKLKVK